MQQKTESRKRLNINTSHQMIFDNEAKENNRAKIVSFDKWCWKNGTPHMQDKNGSR